jgi:hypothetical protein
MPNKIFKIPAAPFNGYSILRVSDQQESCYVAAGIHVPRLITAEELAQDLVRDFRRLRSGANGCPGVWVAEQDNPTHEEIVNSAQYRDARAEQDVLCQNLIIEARTLKSKELENTLSDKHFIAADYLKVTGEDWQKKDLHHGARKQCHFCGHFVGAAVVKCTNCQEIIDPVGYAKLKAAGDAELAAAQQQGEIKDNGGSALRPSKKDKEKDKELVEA